MDAFLLNAWKGFCTETEWKQAYQEINEMEENFNHFGTALIKFWVQIDQEEQLRRFKAREQNPRKQWKLNQEDWRNRDKWKPYEEAVEEMFFCGRIPSMHHGPLLKEIVNDMRIKALDVVIEAIERKIAQKDEVIRV